MRLSTRLVLLMLVCLMPVVGAQIYSHVRLHEQRQIQLGRSAMRQAELADADLLGVLDRVRGLAAVLGQLPDLSATAPGCADKLTALQRGLPEYRFLAIYGAANATPCASAALLAAGAVQPAWTGPPPANSDIGVGRYSASEPIGAFLPVSVRLPARDGTTAQPGFLVVGLDLRWLARHLDEMRLSRPGNPADSSVLLADRDGRVIARLPQTGPWVGRPLPPALLALVKQDSPGVRAVPDADGTARLVASIPAPGTQVGLAVIESLTPPDVLADLEQGAWRDAALLVLATLLALGAAVAVGQRFIHRPTESLLNAARRWRDGDLSARADLSQSGSEFGMLAQSFNAMAANLQARELERRLQADLLEAQVTERTSELSESNNRLQVEIAEREKTEAALHQAQKLQAVGQLAGGIAHDFNNMLATVLGSLELMERRVAQSSQQWTEADADRLRTLIERASNAVQRGAKLTSRLLAFSRRQRLAARSTDVNRLIADLVTLASSTLGSRVRVATELAADLAPAMVDPSQVEAALLNLCLNARDAMPEGGQLTIATSHEYLAQDSQPDDPPAGEYVRINVTDTGVGMPPEVLRRAFDPFFTTKGPGGSGLGLSQVYGMARQSGGTVRIVSTPGEGTEVTLLLPRAAASAADAPHAVRAKDVVRRGVPPTRVLVVDDDHAVRQVIVEMLKDLGYEAIQAASASEALVLVPDTGDPPDLILLDYAMPGMTGLQLARRLRERDITAPIALVTGYAELADSEAGASPLDALLRKPFTIRELDALLVRLRRKAARADAKVVRLQPRERG